MKRLLIAVFASVSLGCDRSSERGAIDDSFDYQLADASASAGFDIIDGVDYTATKGLFDGEYFCVVLEQPVPGDGTGPSSLKRKDGRVLTEIGGATFTLPEPGVFTLIAIDGESELTEVRDFETYPERVRNFIKQAEQAGAPNP